MEIRIPQAPWVAVMAMVLGEAPAVGEGPIEAQGHRTQEIIAAAMAGQLAVELLTGSTATPGAKK
jgi:hypothetical protein